MSKFVNLFVSGMVSGAIYSLIASSLVLCYSASGIFNLAFGGIAFGTAFLYYELHVGLHWPIAAAFIVSVFVVAPLFGWLLDRVVFRHLVGKSDSTKIVATVGLMVAIPAFLRWLVERLVNVAHFEIPLGNDVFTVPGIGPSPKKVWTLPTGATIDSNQVVVFIVAAIAAVGLWFLVKRTRTGLRMRAVVDRPDLATLRGVDRRRLSTVIWMLSTMVAGCAGVIALPILNNLDENAYVFVTFVAIAAAVIGGLRSIPLAFAGGLMLGVLQNLVAGYATFARSISGFNSAVPFVVLILALMVWSRDRARTAGVASEDEPAPDYLADLPRWRRYAPWIGATALFAIYVAFLADDFSLGLAGRGLVLGVIFLSFVIVTGEGGMVSLAQASFVTCAGLAAGLAIDRGASFPVALVLGVAAALALGIVVALPAIRLGGLPLALATLGLAFLGERVLFAWDPFRNGQLGWTVPRPTIGPLDLGNARTFALCMLVFVGLIAFLVRNLQHSASGRSIIAIRSAEPAARMSGLSPVATKLRVFALSAALAGLGGVLLASYNGSVTDRTTPAFVGLVWLATMVLWGIRRPGGAIVAGLVTAWLPQWLSGGIHWPAWVPTWLDWNGTESIYLAPLLFGMGAVWLASNPDGMLAASAMRRYDRRLQRREARRIEVEESAPDHDAARRERELIELGVIRAVPAPEVTPEGTVALTVERAYGGYDELEVIHGVDLELRRGAITVMLGANGAGKSTLCSMVAGLVPVAGGRILLDGVDVTTVPGHRRARMGVVLAPESRGVFPSLTVDENLKIWLADHDEVTAAYDRFPALGTRRSLAAGQLSGGEQQMLTLAPVLIRPPAVLIVDEPTLGLAPLVVGQVLEHISELRSMDVAVLLVEEKARDVLDVAQEVALLELGHISWAGPRAQVDEDRLAHMYLDTGEAERGSGLSSPK